MPASRYGHSRAQLPRHYESDDNPIFSLDDLLDKHEVSVAKHDAIVNRIRKTINEIKQDGFKISHTFKIFDKRYLNNSKMT